MQSIWKRFHHAYSLRGSCVALLSILAITLFAATASAVTPPPMPVSQVNWTGVFPGGNVINNGNNGGNSWAINSDGVIVFSNTYGGEVIQFSGAGDAASEVGPVAGYYNAGGVAIDSSNNLYVSDSDYTYIVKIPMNSNGTYTMPLDPSLPADQPGGATPIPACTGVAATDTATGECLLPMAGDLNSTALSGPGYGVTSLAFDKSGDLYIATNGYGSASLNAGVSYSIFKCAHACLYSATGPSPILIYSEPINATPATGGQLLLGTMAFDPWGNLFFTDDAQVSSGDSVSSNLKEVTAATITAAPAAGYSVSAANATATTVETYTDPSPAQYDDQIATVYVNPNTGTVYFGLADEGIYAIPNSSTGLDTAGLYGVTSQGAELITMDSYGNLYYIAYTSGEELGYLSFGGPTFSETNTTSNLIVADNSEPCTPTLSLTFGATEYSSTAGSCSGMLFGISGSFNDVAVTYTPATTGAVAPTSSLTVTDTTTNDSSSPLTAKGSVVSSADQSTWLAPFTGGGDYGGSSADGHSLAINSKGVVISGSSYSGSGIQEYIPGTAAGTVLGTVGPLGGAGGMAIDSQGFLYASTEYSNTIWKMPMQADGTYAAFSTAPTGLPTCVGDSSTAVDQAGMCQIIVGGDLNFGIAEMTFDKNGNLFITSDGQKNSGTGTYEPYSVLECGPTCLYGSTPTDPVQLWAEPAPDAAGDQYYPGGIAVDSGGNVFFTDSEIAASGSGYSLTSNLYELPTSSGTGYGGVTTGYAAAPNVLENLTPTCAVASVPCTYNNELDAVSVDANNNVFFADQYTGIYELVNNSGSYNTTDPVAIASPGAKAIISDGKGDFYFVGYDSGDTLGYDQVGSVTLSGQATAAAPTSATVNVLDNFACAQGNTLSFSFVDTDFAAPASNSCGAMAFGGGSSYSATITYTPSASASGTVTTTMTATDTMNGGTGTAQVTGQAATAQPITFSGITSPVVYGSGPYTLSATSALSATNAPVFTIDTTTGTQGIASITGDTLTITGVGTFDIDINVAGGASGGTTYAAGYLQVPIEVDQAPQVIAFTGSASVPYTTTPIDLSTEVTSGGSGQPVTFALVSGPGTLSGTKLTITGLGTIALTADQAGDANYLAAPELDFSITVTAAATVATPTITPATGATLTIGSNNSFTIADTTANAVITYTTDGSDPLTSSTALTYSKAVTLSTAGSYTVTAVATLLGDTTSAEATAKYTVVTLAPTFTVSASPSTATVTSSTPGVITITVAPNATFASNITFACTGAPANVTCSFSPNPLVSPATTTTLTVTKNSSAALNHGPNPYLPGGATFAIVLGFLGWKKRRGLFLAAVLLASIVCLTQLTACGGSSSGTTTQMSVTATGGGVTQTLPVSITVK